jgi:hypothetical protein
LTATSCPHCGAEHDPVASPCPESTLVGRTLRAGIRVRERLEDTPVGPLFRAEYPTGAEVAVLLLGSASSNSVALAALRQRFRQAVQIQHPNVAAIHDLSETHDGLVYVVVECLTGELLSEMLARRGALPEPEALDLGLQAAAGLEAAHMVRWVHGNLSPETILLTPTVTGGALVKLIGFAQESLHGNPRSERMAGGDPAADYASPERLAGRALDERSDVYSLGAVLHHLLTGVPPTRASEGALAPEAMQAVLNRALAPSPARRFQTVRELVGAMAPPKEEASVGFLVPEPARARGRNAVPVAAAAAALVAVSAGLWLLWGSQPPAVGGVTRPRSQESGAVARVESDSKPASSAPARLSTDSDWVGVRRDSQAARVRTDSSHRAPGRDAGPDSVPGPRISPFLRSHPWVAVSGQRFYYRSSCPAALESRDLLFFRTEEEARASGFVPSTLPGCR